MAFGRFVGSWDLDMTAIDADGTATAFVGEWHFGWVLQGRAVQDVLVTRTPEGEVVGFGSTIRSFDPDRGLWWVVWQDPLANEFSVLLARVEGDRIVLDRQWGFDDGHDHQWVFSQITTDAFRWEGLVSEDGGGSWRVAERFLARRRDGSA